MWYEILPSMVIICAGAWAPSIFAWYAQKLTQKGNPYRRDLQKNLRDLGLYRRDVYLSGNAYVVKGLDNIPDK